MFKKTSSDSVKALLVGIDYKGTANQLGGCIRDVKLTQQNILAEYPNAVIETMTDDTLIKPTRANILSKLTALISSAKFGDTLMFHYSGHGSQVPDLNGDEEDGYDETICPIDFMTNGQIIDDEIHEIISKVPAGVKFFMLSDSCHSGTIGDLKHDLAHYHGSGEVEDDSETDLVDWQGLHFDEANTQQQVTTAKPSIIANTSWIYVNCTNEVWVTPLNPALYQEFGNKYLKIKLNNIPTMLRQNANKSVFCDTVFTKLDGNTYKIDAVQLGIDRLMVKVNDTKDSKFNLSFNFSYEYDSKACKHRHYAGNSIYSMSMRTPCTIGGELRIISGCEENQTSVGTELNGACTKAFWDTVKSMGGLHQFFPKLFSHHVEDLKSIQETINLNLSNLGFIQHSVISWGHAHGRVKQTVAVPVNPSCPCSSSSCSQYTPTYQSLNGNYGHIYNTIAAGYPAYDPLPLRDALEKINTWITRPKV